MKTPKLEERGTPIQIDPQKGETIEMKVRRITQNKEPITDVAQPIYMERGVKMLKNHNKKLLDKKTYIHLRRQYDIKQFKT